MLSGACCTDLDLYRPSREFRVIAAFFFIYKFSSNVRMDGMTESEPTLSIVVAQALTPTVRSGNSGLLGEFRIESLTCPSKPDTARPTQLTSTGRVCSHRPGHPSQELHISSAERLIGNFTNRSTTVQRSPHHSKQNVVCPAH